MSEQVKEQEAPKKRTLADLNQEYGMLCAKAGELQYKVSGFTKDLSQINQQITDLSFEAAKVGREEAEAKAKEQAEKAKEVTNG